MNGTRGSFARILLTLTCTVAIAAPAWAGDVSVTLDTGTGFAVKNNTGAIQRLRVDEATGNISRNGALFVHTTGAAIPPSDSAPGTPRRLD